MSPPSSGGEAVGEITWGEAFAVLPFGNATALITLTGDQLKTAFTNGFSPVCNSLVNTGRFPAVSGLRATYQCNGTTAVVTGMWKTPDGIGGPQIPIGPTDTVRIVTNDFMLTGGDGYTVFTQASDVVLPGELLLDVLIDHIEANSPVSAAIEGRLTAAP